MELPIQSIMAMPRNAEQLIVCNKSNTIYLINLNGQVRPVFFLLIHSQLER